MLISVIATNIQDTQHFFNASIPEPLPFSPYLRPVTLNEIKSIITDIKFFSPGYDDICLKIMM